MRKAEEDVVRSVRAASDVCAARGDRASFGFVVGRSLREDEAPFSLCSPLMPEYKAARLYRIEYSLVSACTLKRQ